MLHVRAMLKRHGVHFRPLPKRRCPASRGNDRELSPSVIAWLRAATTVVAQLLGRNRWARRNSLRNSQGPSDHLELLLFYGHQYGK